MDSYKRFFEESNLKVLNHKIYTKSIEVSFLKNQIILERIKKFTKIDKDLLEKLEVEFTNNLNFIIRSCKAKHCRKCNKCVTNFDHHCVYLNNCIGQKNYK